MNQLEDLRKQGAELRRKADKAIELKSHQGYCDFVEELESKRNNRRLSSVTDLNSFIAFIVGAIGDAAIDEALRYPETIDKKAQILEKQVSELSRAKEKEQGDPNSLY